MGGFGQGDGFEGAWVKVCWEGEDSAFEAWDSVPTERHCVDDGD